MFQKILVAMDSTPTAQAVFTKAVALAQAMNASLMVLHVLSAEDEGSPGWPLGMVEGSDQSGTSQETPMFFSVYDEINWEAHRRQWQQYEKESREKFQPYSEQAIAMGIKTEFTQLPGKPGQVIKKIAQTWKADLIVMGSRGRTGLSELILGSVSNYVMHHAPCSVLIVHS
ncbi:universal stress protein [Alkalinema pantanalense CENA528]|uniref:universal stress protein n=1 Tax=Alkalinema pantanalense TaxID=1620705 RepID=UPI003D6DFE39